MPVVGKGTMITFSALQMAKKVVEVRTRRPWLEFVEVVKDALHYVTPPSPAIRLDENLVKIRLLRFLTRFPCFIPADCDFVSPLSNPLVAYSPTAVCVN